MAVQLTVNSIEDSFFIKIDGTLKRIKFKDVLFLKAFKGYTRIQMESCHYDVNVTMHRAEEILSPFGFVCSHRSFLVNIEKMSDIDGDSLVISGRFVPLSQGRKKIIKSKLFLLS